MKYKNIVWDWNGTLLDDLQTGVDTLAEMLSRRNIKPLSVEEYKKLFGFPVIDFYAKVGFDLQAESMHDLSVDFVETYDKNAKELQLNEGVENVLVSLKESGRQQYILSALREDLLQQMTADFHISSYFEQICGSDNIYAAGKIDRGKRMVNTYKLCPAETLMVGDTLHDAEVAKALGFDCLLFTGGHNDQVRLRKVAPTISQLSGLLKWLNEFDV